MWLVAGCNHPSTPQRSLESFRRLKLRRVDPIAKFCGFVGLCDFLEKRVFFRPGRRRRCPLPNLVGPCRKAILQGVVGCLDFKATPPALDERENGAILAPATSGVRVTSISTRCRGGGAGARQRCEPTGQSQPARPPQKCSSGPLRTVTDRNCLSLRLVSLSRTEHDKSGTCK